MESGKGLTRQNGPGEELYRVHEAARPLGMKTRTIREWIVNGKIGHVRLGRSVRIPISEVRRLIADNYRPARSA
jgi:excisionase family DNA binding protein